MSGLSKDFNKDFKKGRHEGQTSLALRQLRRRLREIPSELQEQVRGLSAEHLEELGELLLDFNALADLENWLRSQQAVN